MKMEDGYALWEAAKKKDISKVTVLDLSGVEIPVDDEFDDFMCNCTHIRDIILHNCSRETTLRVMWSFLGKNSVPVHFITDLPKSTLPGFGNCMPVDKANSLMDLNMQLYAYGSERTNMAFDCSDYEPMFGDEVYVMLKNPFYQCVGDIFSVAVENHILYPYPAIGYVTLKLLEVIDAEEECGIARVKIMKTGSCFDFLSAEDANVPEGYSYDPPEGRFESKMISNKDGNFFCVCNDLYGDDTMVHHRILTINGVDHLLYAEYHESFCEDTIAFGDIKLGLHGQCPLEIEPPSYNLKLKDQI